MTSRAKEERSRDTPQLHRTASPLTKAEATAGSKPNEANARARRRTDQVGESCGEPGRGVGVCLFEQRNVKALRYLEAETLGPFLQQAAILAIVSSDRLGERGSTRRGGWAVVCVCVCVWASESSVTSQRRKGGGARETAYQYAFGEFKYLRPWMF